VSSDSDETLGLGKRIAFTLLPALLLLGVIELTLRLTGAAKECTGTFETSHLWACDPIMGFKTRPIPGFNETISPDGFRGPALDSRARYTVMAMGDSTTFGEISASTEHPSMFLLQPYPERLQSIADTRDGPEALSVFNAGQCGYNSYQGLLLLRTKFRSLRPNLVTVKYGWNDLLYSSVPPGTFREPSSVIVRDMQDLLFLTASYRYGLKLATDFTAARQAGARPPGALPKPLDTWTPNVPPADFDHNLRRIVEITRRRGSEVWLLTSGDAFMTNEFGGHEDDYDHSAKQQRSVIGLGGIKSFHELEELHARYNDVVRGVAADLGVHLVDLAARVYQQRSLDHLFTPFDAIHPLEAGHALEAEALYLDLKKAGVVGRARWSGGGVRRQP
jgi:lysophospholipase L1-like esterase